MTDHTIQRERLAALLKDIDPDWQRNFDTMRQACEEYDIDYDEVADLKLDNEPELHLESTCLGQAYEDLEDWGVTYDDA